MLKSFRKIVIACGLVGFASAATAMNIYTVKSNDYLYKIAKNNSVSGVSTSELTDAIKGINKSELPGIVNDRIAVGDKLALPTNKDEVEDGLMLARGQSVTSQPTATTTQVEDIPPIIDGGDDLGDASMMVNAPSFNTSKPTTVQKLQQPRSQHSTSAVSDVPDTIYPVSNDSDDAATYQQSFDSQIKEARGQKEVSTDTEEGISFLTLIGILIVLVALGFFGKKYWDTRSIRKEKELEIISKKRRDHLMSRISPIVSDASYYSAMSEPEEVKVPQEAQTDFFEISDSEHIPQQDLQEEFFEEEVEAQKYGESSKSVMVETDRGVVFETSTGNDVVVEELDEVEENDFEEDELAFVFELVEQYLDSHRFEEARFTIQDSLEKYPSNVELRYALLQVYAISGEEIAFEGEVHFIKSKGIVSMFDPLHQKITKLREKYFV